MNLMRLTDEDIREFKEAYQAEFHEAISDAEARDMADRVMRIMELITQPLPEDGGTLVSRQGNAIVNSDDVHPNDPLP